jgi:putative acyl-CoA dehydrogenase
MLSKISPVTSSTHHVENQVGSLVDFNAFNDDSLLLSILKMSKFEKESTGAEKLGLYAGLENTQELAYLANRFAPELISHDRLGNRVDEVRYHPSYHSLMDSACHFGVHSLAWQPDVKAPFTSHAVSCIYGIKLN